MIEQIERLREIFTSKNSFVITSHINPDADALGSETALARFLSDQGKRVTILNQSETPENLQFLTAVFPITTYHETHHAQSILDAECFIVVDTNAVQRFKALEHAFRKTKALKILIDHHLEPEPFADIAIVDFNAPATAEILFNILTTLDEQGITPPVAEALYAGIMSDTGSFKFPLTTAETHRITAALIERGAQPYKIYQQIYESGNLSTVHLLGKALESITLHCNGKVAAMILPQSTFTETGTKESDVDNLTQYILTIKNVVLGIVFVELENAIKISYRSKGNIPVNEAAKLYGGGGHKNAAGARIKNISLSEAVNEVLNSVAPFITNSKGLS